MTQHNDKTNKQKTHQNTNRLTTEQYTQHRKLNTVQYEPIQNVRIISRVPKGETDPAHVMNSSSNSC